MNVLREMRKFKSKSVIAKIRILILLFVMLIGSTYAWFYTKKEINISSIRGKVTEWDLEYSAEGEIIKQQEYVMAVDHFYPGSYTKEDSFEKVISIQNMTVSESIIGYNIVSVRLFGEEILGSLRTEGDYKRENNRIDLFSTEKYPFEVGITYDKTKIQGIYEDDEKTPESVAKCTFFAIWDYERIGTTMNIVDNNKLDTSIGERAYAFYQNNPNKPALEVIVKIDTGREGRSVIQDDDEEIQNVTESESISESEIADVT